jgi:hypothetical protein
MNLPSPPSLAAAPATPRLRRGRTRRALTIAGWLFVAAAAAAVAGDLAKATASGELRLAPLGQVWADLHRTSLLLFQPAVERYLTPWLWRAILQPVLEAPAAIVLLVPGLALLLAGRPRRAPQVG